MLHLISLSLKRADAKPEGLRPLNIVMPADLQNTQKNGAPTWRIKVGRYYTYLPAYEDGTDSVPKCRYMKFRRRSIAQNKAYNDEKYLIFWLFSITKIL
jgi:hypothetical protein